MPGRLGDSQCLAHEAREYGVRLHHTEHRREPHAQDGAHRHRHGHLGQFVPPLPHDVAGDLGLGHQPQDRRHRLHARREAPVELADHEAAAVGPDIAGPLQHAAGVAHTGDDALAADERNDHVFIDAVLQRDHHPVRRQVWPERSEATLCVVRLRGQEEQVDRSGQPVELVDEERGDGGCLLHHAVGHGQAVGLHVLQVLAPAGADESHVASREGQLATHDAPYGAHAGDGDVLHQMIPSTPSRRSPRRCDSSRSAVCAGSLAGISRMLRSTRSTWFQGMLTTGNPGGCRS